MSKDKKNSISRKDALKTLGGLALFPLAPSMSSNAANQEEKIHPKTKTSLSGKQKAGQVPNILFIIDDQHRGDFLGAAGAQWIKTPHLDNLAKEGARFSNAYCALPSCTPARTSILTGLKPWNHGMLGYMDTIAQYYKQTMPQFFSEMGYQTIVVGKNHFGPPRNSNGYLTSKLEEGWYSSRKDGFDCDYQSWFQREAPDKDLNATGLGYTDHRGIPFKYEDKLHATHWTAERAIEFLQQSKNEAPWFLKLSFQRPHPPFDPPKRWFEYYRSADIPKPKVGDWAKEKYEGKIGSLEKTPSASSGIFPDPEVKNSRAAYAASISFVDEQLGLVIDEIKKTDQYENTFILFVSDHGDMMGDQYMWRKCRPYEPSANVPLIIRWPEMPEFNFKRGQVRDELIELRDIFPTFADACHLAIPEPIDGSSILNILDEKQDWRKTLCLEHSQVYEPDNAWVAITDGRYKYIFFTLTGEEQLFDLKNDPDELVDIVKQQSSSEIYRNLYAELAKELLERGPKWVENGKLQIQTTSDLTGVNFPKLGSSSF
jgi:arylsulfatase